MKKSEKTAAYINEIQELAELLKHVPEEKQERLLEQMKFGAMVAVMFSKKAKVIQRSGNHNEER